MRDKSSSNLRLIWSQGVKDMSEAIAAEVRTICRHAAEPIEPGDTVKQQIRRAWEALQRPPFWRVRSGFYGEGGSWSAAAVADFQRRYRTLMEGRVRRAVHAARRAASGQVGRLRIGCTGSGFFNPVVVAALRGYIASYPDVDVVLEEDNSVGLLERLREGVLDAAFLRPQDQDLAGLRIHRTMRESMLVALPDEHPLTVRPRVGLVELREDRLVLHQRHRGPQLHDAIVDACRAAGFEPVLGQTAQQFPTIINLVASGLGVSVVPASLGHSGVRGVHFRQIEAPAPLATLRLASSYDRASHSATLAHFVADTLGAMRDFGC